MSRNKRIPKGKVINPTFYVFCEGETEEAYINYLRSKYRLPILIDAKIAGNRITGKYIQNCKKDKANHPKDITYLVYDSKECIQKLKQQFPNYGKGLFNNDLKNKIEKGQSKAVNIASKLQEFKNPSSQMFVFINEIEKVKKQNNKL